MEKNKAKILEVADYPKGVAYIANNIWDNKLGKTIVILSGGLVALGLLGIGFKVSAFTMNCYKDFRAASKR